MTQTKSQLSENEIEKNKRLRLVRSKLNIGQDEMAHKLGLNRSNLSKIENIKENRNVPNGTSYILEREYNVNRQWFETGEGSMFLSQPYSQQDIEVDNTLAEPDMEYKVNLVKGVQVPIYDVEFAVGVMTSLIEGRDNHYPVGYLSIPEVSGCDAIIRAKGDSMAERINDRDWIGIKRIDKDAWFPMGYIYAIETDQVQIIKYIKKGSSKDTYTIESHNKFYEPDELPKSAIKELWSVRAILPGNIETLI